MPHEPLFYDSHMHTPLCRHAIGEPEDYAYIAERRGLRGIIFTCHNPVPNGWGAHVRMKMEQFPQYLAIIERARQKWEGKIDIRLGLESDYVPGMEQWLEELHARAAFDYILGSVHPQLGEYQDEYFKGDAVEFQRTYFEHLAMAAETKLIDCLAHPDLVKNICPDDWRLPRIMDTIRRSLDRIARAGAAMELNTSGLHKDIPEMNPGPVILKEMFKRQIPVVIGSDSHMPNRVGADFEQAFDLLEDAGYREVRYYIQRQPRAVAIVDARVSLTAVQSPKSKVQS